MIVSASRRTDIPAFYGEWFMEGIGRGFFTWRNPFNAADVREYSLKPRDVDAFVFWSKYPAPFVRHLRMLDDMGYKYYFQYTLNDYPSWFEPGMPALERRLDAFCMLSEMLGRERVVWRYDPVAAGSETPPEWHLERISGLLEVLGGKTERLVLSFMDFYRGTAANLRKLEAEKGISFYDIAAPGRKDELAGFAGRIAEMCGSRGIEVYTCSEKADLSDAGIGHGACIDAGILAKLCGDGACFVRDTGQRSSCRCVKSVDMGLYGTCRFGCIYCYAVQNRRKDCCV